MSIKIKIGDLVMLKSGGPIMVVDSEILTEESYIDTVRCMWFNQNHILQKERFKPDTLIIQEDK